jgi:hypothetical protein
VSVSTRARSRRCGRGSVSGREAAPDGPTLAGKTASSPGATVPCCAPTSSQDLRPDRQALGPHLSFHGLRHVGVSALVPASTKVISRRSVTARGSMARSLPGVGPRAHEHAANTVAALFDVARDQSVTNR